MLWVLFLYALSGFIWSDCHWVLPLLCLPLPTFVLIGRYSGLFCKHGIHDITTAQHIEQCGTYIKFEKECQCCKLVWRCTEEPIQQEAKERAGAK